LRVDAGNWILQKMQPADVLTRTLFGLKRTNMGQQIGQNIGQNIGQHFKTMQLMPWPAMAISASSTPHGVEENPLEPRICGCC